MDRLCADASIRTTKMSFLGRGSTGPEVDSGMWGTR